MGVLFFQPFLPYFLSETNIRFPAHVSVGCFRLEMGLYTRSNGIATLR